MKTFIKIIIVPAMLLITSAVYASNVDIVISGLLNKDGWTSLKTEIRNNSAEDVKSIQFTVPAECFKKDENGVIITGRLAWDAPFIPHYLPGDKFIILTADLSKQPIKAGVTTVLEGQFENLAAPLRPDMIQASYNKIFYTVNYRLPEDMPRNGKPLAIIDNKRSKLAGQDNKFFLAEGDHSVEIPDIYSDGKVYIVTGYDKNLSVKGDTVQTLACVPQDVKTVKVSFNVTLPGKQLSSNVCLADIVNECGYWIKDYHLFNGDNELQIPEKGNFEVKFEGVPPWYVPSPGHLAVKDGCIIDKTPVVYSDKTLLRVGYAGIGSHKKFAEVIKKHNYNMLVVYFFDMSGDRIIINNRYYDSRYSSEEAVKNSVKEGIAAAKRLGAKVLISFGGEPGSNTFMPGETPLETVAVKIVKYANDLGADGVDFDLEMPSTIDDYPKQKDFLYTLTVEIKKQKPDLIVAAAPQLNKTETGIKIVSAGLDGVIYEKAVQHGVLDYLFVQLYNTAGFEIGGHTEKDPEFIVSSFDWLKNNVKEPTKIVSGEPASADAAGEGCIYQKDVNKQEEAWRKVKAAFNELVTQNDNRFGGSMVWCIEKDEAAGWGFSNTVFK